MTSSFDNVKINIDKNFNFKFYHSSLANMWIGNVYIIQGDSPDRGPKLLYRQ